MWRSEQVLTGGILFHYPSSQLQGSATRPNRQSWSNLIRMNGLEGRRASAAEAIRQEELIS